MKRFNLLGLFIVACFWLNAQVVDKAGFPILEKINQSNINYGTIASDFKQIKHLPILGEELVSGGKFYYSKPDRLAMRYTDPQGDLMLIDGERFVMMVGGKKRETSAKSNAKMRGMKTILAACLEGNVLQMGADKIDCKETPKYYVVTAGIDNKLNKSGIKKVVASYNKSNLTLAVLETIEKDDSSTVYELTNVKPNASIENDIFTTNKK